MVIMSSYVIIYFIILLLILYLWLLTKKNYKNISWDYYFIFSYLWAFWVLLYFIFYIIDNSFYLLIISKTTFLLSILSLYFFIKFIFSIGDFTYTKIIKKHELIIIIFLIILYLFTDLIINDIWYSKDSSIYYEIYWKFIYFHHFITILLFFWIIYSFYFKFKTLEYINKIRLKIIFYSFLFFLFFWILFQTILPYFWLYFFYKELIYFLFPFIILSWYSSTRYHFSDIVLKYNQIFSFILSTLITIIIIFYGKSINLNNPTINDFWWISNNFTYSDVIFSIIFFSIFYKTFISLLPLNKDYYNFSKLLNKLKEQIPFLIDFDWLQEHLRKFISDNFKVNYININLNIDKNIQIYEFFDNKKNNDIFINDIVFLSENKYRFDLEKLKNELNPEIYLIIPMRDNLQKIIWFFELWKKPFREHYFTDEINIIKDFSNFLSWHLRYIEIYSKINYLTINLDTEVDKKTIEYNNLINKLKEFISISSHEIKTPIMSISLQVESIVDDINDGNTDIDYIKNELNLLQSQVYKISDLVKVLFNIERYDIWKVSLYIEKINLENLFLEEIESLYRLSSDLKIDFIFNCDIDYIDLDKIQFSQVISNLLHNALKFCSKEKPIISIDVKQIKNNISIKVEDNWNWFKKREQEFIFDKYSTWYWKSIWLWLWLYLCKKIVEFHNWFIKAWNSKKLWWAMITINIPIYQKKEN